MCTYVWQHFVCICFKICTVRADLSQFGWHSPVLYYVLPLPKMPQLQQVGKSTDSKLPAPCKGYCTLLSNYHSTPVWCHSMHIANDYHASIA